MLFCRQRHFSLEDYNDLIMESSNSNASIDNSTDDNNMMINGGSDDQPTSATITSFANLGKFFSNFNSSPLSRRNSFSTVTQGVGAKFVNNDSTKPYNGEYRKLSSTTYFKITNYWIFYE